MDKELVKLLVCGGIFVFGILLAVVGTLIPVIGFLVPLGVYILMFTALFGFMAAIDYFQD